MLNKPLLPMPHKSMPSELDQLWLMDTELLTLTKPSTLLDIQVLAQ
jgi:hypothetical protein